MQDPAEFDEFYKSTRTRLLQQTFALTGEITIGRDAGCTVQIDGDTFVSSRHARVFVVDGQAMVEDLGSTNGTFVNGERRLLPGDRQPLNDGDEIIIGKTFLRFRVVK